MENEEKAIKEIKNIRMSDKEKDQIFNNILTTNITERYKKPVNSTFSFSMLWNNSYIFYFTVLCLIILGGGLFVISNQKNIEKQTAFNYKTESEDENLITTTSEFQEKSTLKNEELSQNQDEDKKIALTPQNQTTSTITKKETGTLSAVTSTNNTQPPTTIPTVLKNIFDQYKNGQISECNENGITYYSASENVYDGGGATYDTNGNVVGEYQGFTGKYTGVNPKNCTRIYVIEKNIWGYPTINKYNLK